MSCARDDVRRHFVDLPPANPHCTLVDDDTDIRGTLACTLEASGIPVRTYESGEQFLAAVDQGLEPDLGCLILDIALPGLSGLDVLERLRAASHDLPILIVSGQSAFADAARAVQAGASGIYQKPISPGDLVGAVKPLLADWSRRQTVRREITAKLAALSRREREVMDALVSGSNTTQIAHSLGISPSTVEKHRLRVFEKTGIDSAVGLVNWLASLH